MASLLEYLTGVGEVGAALGSGAVSGLVGSPYGVYKGVTSGKYGTPEGVKVAQQAAGDFMARNTYQPRGQVAQDALQGMGGLLSASKLPPVIPEAMALSSMPMKNIASAQKPGGVLAEVGGTPLPSVFVHGTSPENAAAIRKAGKFDPSVGERAYEYSQMGHRTSYFAPEGSWWLDPELAANGRAAVYKDAVKMQLDKSAKVKVIDSEEQLHKIAKEAGFIDASDMMDSLYVDDLGTIPNARKANSMSFDEYLANYVDQQKKQLRENKWEDVDKIKNFDDLSNRLNKFYSEQGYSFKPETLDSVKSEYARMKTFEKDAYSLANEATDRLIRSGADGLYISPKYAQSVSDPLASWHPASDQLALFRPELAKVLEEPVNNKLLDMVGK